MKILRNALSGCFLLLSFVGISQTQIFTAEKSAIGGQNVQYLASINSFVFASNGHLKFYSLDVKGLTQGSIQLSSNEKQKISGIAVNNAYNYVAAADKDSIYVADLLSSSVIKSIAIYYEGHYGDTFNTLDFSTSEEEFIYYDGKQIVIKNVADWQTIDSIPYKRSVYSLDMHSMENVFVAGDDRYGFDMYNLVDKTCDSSVITSDPNDPYYSINQGKTLKNGDVITFGFQGFDGIRIWENKKSKYHFGDAGHAGDYNGFAFTPDESLMAYAEYDIYSYEEDFAVILKVVDMNTKKLKHAIRIPMERQFDINVNALSLSPDGRYLATSEFYKVKIWKLY